MKWLLVLMLAGTLSAQTKDDKQLAPMNKPNDPYGKIIVGEPRFAPYTGKIDSEFSAYILSIFERGYSRYEAECFADSTAKEGWWFGDRYIPRGNGDYSLPGPIETRWVHRAPTFEGFLNFLRKQR